MEYLRRLFSRPQPQNSAGLSSSILGTIPPEILVYIIDHLLPESAVAFSLTCKHLKCLLGTRNFLRVHSSTQSTLALLDLLALDLPNHIACYPCKRLHQMKNLLRYNGATYSTSSIVRKYDSLRRPACVSHDQGNNVHAVTNLFGTTAFKMVIKSFHEQSTESAQLLKLVSSKEVTTMTTGDYVQQYREECRIVSGCLLHRLQSVYMSWKFPNSTAMDLIHNPPSELICPHLNLSRSIQNNTSGVRKCQGCRTEYRIDFQYYDGYGFALFLTRWKNLGPGPESELWTQHLLPSCAALSAMFFPTQLDAKTSMKPQVKAEHWKQDGSISSSFGDGGGDNFESFWTSSNRVALWRFKKQFSATAD